MENQVSIREEGKTNAIISYITIIGTIVALILNKDKKNPFTSFHIRQMLGLSIVSILNSIIVYGYINYILGLIISIALFVFWIIGFMGVLKGKEEKIPLLGEQFQEWFKNI